MKPVNHPVRKPQARPREPRPAPPTPEQARRELGFDLIPKPRNSP